MNRTLIAGVSVLALAAGSAEGQSQSEQIRLLREQLQLMQDRLEQLESQQQQQSERIEEAEERVGAVTTEDGEPLIKTDRSGWQLELAARVNQAFLYADQGGDASQGFIVDNDGSGSRVEFGATRSWGDLTSGVDIVFSAEVNSTDEIDFGSTDDSEDENPDLGEFRQANWFIEHPTFGFLSIGQGDTAAEDAAHADLSGTDFAGAGSDVDDIAGGLTFFDDDGNPLTEVDDFFDVQDGSRSLRVLYISPSFAGFAVKASVANDQQSLEDDDDIESDGLEPQVGVEFAGAFSDWEVEAAGSWRFEDEVDANNQFVVGSASVLAPFGLNLTLAGSYGFQDEGEDTTAIFGKVGYRTRLFDFGETRFSFDVYRGRNEADFAAPDGELPEAMSYGLFAVQSVEPLSTEFYAGGRLYTLDEVFQDGEEVDVDSLFAFITGARVRF